MHIPYEILRYLITLVSMLLEIKRNSQKDFFNGKKIPKNSMLETLKCEVCYLVISNVSPSNEDDHIRGSAK